jgi:hypothetical protein
VQVGARFWLLHQQSNPFNKDFKDFYGQVMTVFLRSSRNTTLPTVPTYFRALVVTSGSMVWTAECFALKAEGNERPTCHSPYACTLLD